MVENKEVRTVDISWPPEMIKQFCEAEDNWVLMLDANMTAEQLRALYCRQRNASSFYMGMIAEIAEHPHAPSDVLNAIVDSYLSDIEVLKMLTVIESESVT